MKARQKHLQFSLNVTGEPSELVLVSRSGDDDVLRNDATHVNNDSYVICHVSLTFTAKCILCNV